MFAWGANSHGQLGNGRTDDLYVPEKLKFNYPVSLIAGGGGHSLVVSDNVILSCGSNEAYQLARANNNQHEFSSISFTFPSQIKSIKCGWDFSVAITIDGSLYTWGSNKHGQLGVKGLSSSNVPMRVDLEPIHSVAAGLRHVVAVTKSGLVFTWGSNRRNQLGLFEPDCASQKSNEDCFTPLCVNLLSSVSFIAEDCSAGAYHTVIKTSSGDLVVWGDLTYFESNAIVSSDSSNQSAKFLFYNSHSFSGYPVKEVVSGWSHIAVRNSVGEVFTWGRGDLGQLGRLFNTDSCFDSRSTNSQTICDKYPGKVLFSRNNIDNIDICVCNLSSGSEHMLAVDSHGHLWTWGWNEHGMCGLYNNLSDDEINESKNQKTNKLYKVDQPNLVSFFQSNLENLRDCIKCIGCGYGHSMVYVE